MAAPINHKGPRPEKIWRDAIARAVKRVDKGVKGTRLERLADQIVKQGIEGDVAAMKEIGDRLDGKAPQAISGGDGEGLPMMGVILVPAKSSG